MLTVKWDSGDVFCASIVIEVSGDSCLLLVVVCVSVVVSVDIRPFGSGGVFDFSSVVILVCRQLNDGCNILVVVVSYEFENFDDSKLSEVFAVVLVAIERSKDTDKLISVVFDSVLFDVEYDSDEILSPADRPITFTVG